MKIAIEMQCGTVIQTLPAEWEALIEAIINNPAAWLIRLITDDGDDIGRRILTTELLDNFRQASNAGMPMDVQHERFIRMIARGDLPGLMDRVRRIRTMRRAINENYSPQEMSLINSKLSAIEADGEFRVVDSEIRQRGNTLLGLYAVSGSFAYHLLPVSNEDAEIIPIIRNGKSLVMEFTGDEGGQSGALALCHFKSGRNTGKSTIISLSHGIWAKELNCSSREIAENRFNEAMAGDNVWTRKPAGWV